MATILVEEYLHDAETDVELTLECECLVRPATPDNFRGHPDNWSPGHPEEFEIEAIIVREFGRTYYISQDEAEALGFDATYVEDTAFKRYRGQEPDYESMLND
jgi:hypothetical protein